MNKSKVGEGYALRWAKKIRAINFLGGKCKKCGNNDVMVLEFHHLKDKDLNISKMKGSRWSLIEKELKKCILLCANCHSETHYINSRGCKLKDDILMELNIKPQCVKCGYRGNNLKSLCFHHKKEKIFNISSALARKVKDCSVQDIIDEIQKCDILCRNCHVTEHSFYKFNKTKPIIYEKVKNHKEQYRINESVVKKLKNEGRGVCEIARILGKNKSSIHYVFHRV